MYTKTQKLMLQGTLILLGALVVSSLGGWARRATADDQPVPVTAPVLGELRSLTQELEAAKGELAVARLQLERADAIIEYSGRYGVPADLAAATYDIALAEGVDPVLAFRLVRLESGFNPRAKSREGALGLTQVLPSTARLYAPGLTTSQPYDRDTNLRLGLRYLHDLLVRYRGRLDLALLAYRRGPSPATELLVSARDPDNGYAATLMKGYRRKG